MTKSTITDKRVTSVIERLEHYACNLKWTNVRGAQDLLTAADGLRELQERRKADSEPVILYRQVNPVNGMKTYWAELDPEEFRHLKQHTDENAEFMTLYRHAQQSVVLDAIDTNVIETLRLVQCMLDDYRERNYGDAQGWIRHINTHMSDYTEAHGDDAYSVLHNLITAAPQSPGSEPAAVPGKWIPVSEKMPPSRHEVLVGRWWGEKPRWCCKWATYIPGQPDTQSSGWLIPGASWTPTHWMELPAAPQEVKP